MVSIKDVARIAGVSDKTVSRVVNREPNVTQDTIEKVQSAIDALGYIPNLAARSIRSSRTNIIGIITDYISTTPYSGDIVRGVQDWAGANGRTVLLANTDGNAEREANIWRTFKAHRIDGVLYVAMYHRTVAPASGDVSIPTVLVNSHAEAGLTYSSIEPDDFGGSYALTQHLVELGHRRIGYIRLNPCFSAPINGSTPSLLRHRQVALPKTTSLSGWGWKGQSAQKRTTSIGRLSACCRCPTALRRLCAVMMKWRFRPTSRLCLSAFAYQTTSRSSASTISGLCPWL